MSLIEVMVAGAIFASGAAAILSATANYMNVIEHERKLADAWRILQAEAGHARTLPDSHAAWTTAATTTVNELGLPAAPSVAKFTVTTKPATNKPHAGARQMTIVVSWAERAGARSASVVIHR